MFSTVKEIFADKLPYKFIIFASLLFGSSFTLDNINGRAEMFDYKVYYLASEAFLNHSPIYGESFGLNCGLYKYSPFTLALFTPSSLLSYKSATIIHFFISVISLLFSILIVRFFVIKYMYFKNPKYENLALSFVVIFLLRHFIRELHMGNINAILLLFILLSILLFVNGKNASGGFFLAIVLITKPYFGLLLIPLLLRKNYKALLFTGSFVIIFIILPALFVGEKENIDIHLAWIDTILNHNSSYTSNETIFSILHYYFNISFSGNTKFYFIGLLLIIYTFYFIYHSRRVTENPTLEKSTLNFLVECFIIIAIIPNIFNNDTQQFLYTMPLIVLLTYFIFSTKNYYNYIFYFIILFMFGGNSLDLMGDPLSFILDEMGILGISNVIIIGTAIFIFSHKRKAIKLNT